jgi:hypothetical protein
MSKHYGQLMANNQIAITEQLQRIQELYTQRLMFKTGSPEYKGVMQQINKCKQQITWHERAVAELMAELRQQPTFHELPRSVA